MRPDWDSYFLKIAFAVSERSTCDRAFVGCVLVLDKRILTTGFNGSPAGQAHCDEVGHLIVDGHCVRTIHAETNAIIQAALHGVLKQVRNLGLPLISINPLEPGPIRRRLLERGVLRELDAGRHPEAGPGAVGDAPAVSLGDHDRASRRRGEGGTRGADVLDLKREARLPSPHDF